MEYLLKEEQIPSLTISLTYNYLHFQVLKPNLSSVYEKLLEFLAKIEKISEL